MLQLFVKFLFFYIFLFSSCSSPEKNENTFVVDLKYEKKKIVVDSKVEHESFGPMPNKQYRADDFHDASQKREPVVALVLPPYGFYTFGLVGLFKALEQADISVNMIVGSGTGLILGLMYADDPEVNVLEWNLFKMVREISDGLDQRGDRWNQQLFSAISGIVKSDDISKLSRMVVVPRAISKKRFEYIKKGQLEKIVKNELKQTQEAHWRNIDDYINQAFSSESLRKLGADIILYPVFDNISRSNYEQADLYFWYKRVTIGLNKLQGDSIVKIRYSVDESMSLSTGLIQSRVTSCFEATMAQIEKVKNTVTHWNSQKK